MTKKTFPTKLSAVLIFQQLAKTSITFVLGDTFLVEFFYRNMTMSFGARDLLLGKKFNSVVPRIFLDNFHPDSDTQMFYRKLNI